MWAGDYSCPHVLTNNKEPFMKYLYITLALGTTALHSMEQPVEKQGPTVEEIMETISDFDAKLDTTVTEAKHIYTENLDQFTKKNTDIIKHRLSITCPQNIHNFVGNISEENHKKCEDCWRLFYTLITARGNISDSVTTELGIFQKEHEKPEYAEACTQYWARENKKTLEELSNNKANEEGTPQENKQ
jgi:hypothetical protein